MGYKESSKRVPFFDLEWAFKHTRYAHNPYVGYASFVSEPSNCAKYYWALCNDRRNDAVKCATKCKLCLDICTFNDYVRGQLPPNYPVPATLDHAPDVAFAKAQWYAQSEPWN